MAGQVKILVVDDNFGIRKLLTRLFESKQYLTTSVADGREAIEIAKKEVFDIAFLDMQMPGLNGFETLRELKKLCVNMAPIVMTGYADVEMIKMAEKEGAVTCLEKPFNIQAVEAEVEKIINSRKSPSAMT